MGVIVKGIDFRSLLPPVRDQGERGTCLAFAVTSCHETERALGQAVTKHLSEEGLYWGSRQFSSNTSGISFFSVITALDRWGQPDAYRWPYDGRRDENAPEYRPPADALLPKHCFQATLSQLALDATVFERSLRQGRPVVLVVKMSQQFFMAPGGRISIPLHADIVNDNHAVLVVGFANDGILVDHFIIRNSWGSTWGDAGYGYLPYEYVSQWGILAGSASPIFK